MFKTRMTELFGIKHPIMLAGMNWITEPELVSTVCNAGGLGIFATARCTPEETRQNIRQIRELTDKPNLDRPWSSGKHTGSHRGKGPRDKLLPGKALVH